MEVYTLYAPSTLSVENTYFLFKRLRNSLSVNRQRQMFWSGCENVQHHQNHCHSHMEPVSVDISLLCCPKELLYLYSSTGYVITLIAVQSGFSSRCCHFKNLGSQPPSVNVPPREIAWKEDLNDSAESSGTYFDQMRLELNRDISPSSHGISKRWRYDIHIEQ